jgi:hypothetical protein
MCYAGLDVTGRDGLAPIAEAVQDSEVSGEVADCVVPCCALMCWLGVAIMTDEKERERELILGTIKDIEDSIRLARGEMHQAMEKISAKEARLAVWKKKLTALKGRSEPEAAPLPVKRRKRG